MVTKSPPRWDVLSQQCPTRQVLARTGDRWSVLVVTALTPGLVLRFSELRRQVEGVSQKMLTQTLRGLERDGLVDREVEATVPVTVRYSLTARGGELAQVLAVVREWAYAHVEDIDRSRRDYDARQEGLLGAATRPGSSPAQPAAAVPRSAQWVTSQKSATIP